MRDKNAQCSCIDRKERIQAERDMAELNRQIKRQDMIISILKRLRLQNTSIGKTANIKLTTYELKRAVAFHKLNSHVKRTNDR
jgi:hypothetical protein